MIKLTISDKLEKVIDFIENRLVLLMSEKKLRQLKPMGGLGLMFKEQYRVKNIDNTILFLENEPKKATLVISTIEKKKGDNPKSENYGVAIRNKDENEIEFYIDSLAEAFNKGIISTDLKRKIFSMKILGYALLAIFLLAIISVTGGLAFFGICILVVITYPIQYLLSKRIFRKRQEKMNGIVSLFESEFNVTDKTDTKDWINFWGQVKSDVKSQIRDATPFSYR